jgi:hypothetical protein
MVGKAGQGARVGRQMLLVMHAACPPLRLQIVVDVYVAQPGPLYGASLSGSVGSAAHALLVIHVTWPPLPLHTVVAVYEAHDVSGGSDCVSSSSSSRAPREKRRLQSGVARAVRDGGGKEDLGNNNTPRQLNSTHTTGQ